MDYVRNKAKDDRCLKETLQREVCARGRKNCESYFVHVSLYTFTYTMYMYVHQVMKRDGSDEPEVRQYMYMKDISKVQN